jgi:hypothetical protein
MRRLVLNLRTNYVRCTWARRLHWNKRIQDNRLAAGRGQNPKQEATRAVVTAADMAKGIVLQTSIGTGYMFATCGSKEDSMFHGALASLLIGATAGVPAGVVTPFAVAKFGPVFGCAASTAFGLTAFTFVAVATLRKKTTEVVVGHPHYVTSGYRWGEHDDDERDEQGYRRLK